jgi:CO dehydrogenase/acetyl-CoA synthase gamma subunit (corrinoid Fe-S protein)
MEKVLSEIDAWLLVVNTNGINVWCSSAGKEMTVYNTDRHENLPN